MREVSAIDRQSEVLDGRIEIAALICFSPRGSVGPLGLRRSPETREPQRGCPENAHPQRPQRHREVAPIL